MTLNERALQLVAESKPFIEYSQIYEEMANMIRELVKANATMQGEK